MSDTAALSSPPTQLSPTSRLRRWWQEPRLTLWVLLALALLLFLRKPHALHTPQLWAEDGSIFLAFNDLDGARALVTPYMGYLHTIPRLVAWTASKLLDPAWWPAFYNGAAFVIWLAVMARTFSRRLNWPGKPWLALAFLLGPHSGEILGHITNVQWVTAFVFVQQALMARPENARQRGTDLALLLVVGLTGPFAIAFVPLFAWRWWRDRNGDNVAALLVVAGCAAVQAWFTVKTGPAFEHQGLPLNMLNLFAVVGRRLVLWPLLGDRLALAAPVAVASGIGLVLSLAFSAWVLRPHPRRELRAMVLASAGLMLAAALWRTRADTWGMDNLHFSDRYFHLPRVLIAWLLVWEFDTRPRAIGFVAAGACAAAALLHLPNYMFPAPRDYYWAKHVEPIRRGVPANIPILPEGWTLEYRGRPDARKAP